MKLFSIFLLLVLSFNVAAQKAGDVLATANGQNYTALDLAPEARAEFENLPRAVADARRALLEQQISEMLFAAEAAAQKTTVEKLIDRNIKSKIPAATDAQIAAVYEANRAAVGDKTLAEIRPQIVAFLERDARQKVYSSYLSELKIKYKTALGKDVNAPDLTAFEVLATVGEQQITARAFEAAHKPTLAEIEADALDHARESLETTIYYNLLSVEAKTQSLDSGDLIGREVTGKSKTGSAEEINGLETALRRRLFQKYNAKFLLKEIAPVVQNVSVDDDPAQGKADAPVTIVMFTDYQCPACAATNPIVKTVLADYAGKTRFVVRDFPLTNIHENAFQAAVAANAAHAQGKFHEYTEVLYQNQTKLDAASLVKYAADLRLNVKSFEAALTDPKVAEEVRKDVADGKKYALNSTPTIFVNGVKVRHFSPENFRRAIEKALLK